MGIASQAGPAATAEGTAGSPANDDRARDDREADKGADTMTEPTIVRIWRGRTRPERADEYERYNYEAGVKPLIDKALGVQALRRDGDTETEFMTISYWADVAAMAEFTSADPYDVHHLQRDPEFLIELPDHVEVFEIRAAHGTAAARAGTSPAGGTDPSRT